MTNIAILGGGPSALIVYKRLSESDTAGLAIDIYEQGGDLGSRMLYTGD